MSPARTRLAGAALAATLLIAGCGEIVDGGSGRADRDAETTSTAGEGTSAPHVVGCDRRTIGEEAGQLVVAYGVTDGELSELPCLGTEGEGRALERAWSDAVRLAPDAVAGTTVLAGYRSEPDADPVTLGTATPIGFGNARFAVALDLEQEPDALLLTLLHELAHVFTQTPSQLDPTTDAPDCAGFWNGFGCFEESSLVADWIAVFWDADDIDQLPGDGALDTTGGRERCEEDDGFPGPYAAGHPEEDLAESFALAALGLPLDPDRLAFFVERELIAGDSGASGTVVDPTALERLLDRCGVAP